MSGHRNQHSHPLTLHNIQQEEADHHQRQHAVRSHAITRRRNLDPITQNVIPAGHRVVVNRTPYDVTSLAALVHHASLRDPVYGARPARLPHSRREVTRAEAAAWTARAESLGWEPEAPANNAHVNTAVPVHLRNAAAALRVQHEVARRAQEAARQRHEAARPRPYALHTAIRGRDFHTARALLAAGANSRAREGGGGGRGFTPLHLAVVQSHMPTIQVLLAADVDPSSPAGHSGTTPLHIASQQGHLLAVQTLLRAGANPRAREVHRDVHGHAPLHMAAEFGHLPVVQALLAAGADVNAAHSRTGHTPLHTAATRGHLPTIRALLNAGADPRARNAHGRTPAEVAARHAHVGATPDIFLGRAAVMLEEAHQRGRVHHH